MPGLSGPKTPEAWELRYFELYKSQLKVVELALETAALTLGTDKSRGYSLEMICADFLAGANLEAGNPQALKLAVQRLVLRLPDDQRDEILEEARAARRA